MNGPGASLAHERDVYICACAPYCVALAEQTDYSPYMDDYCDHCTMHRCDAEGYHVVNWGWAVTTGGHG